MNYRLVLWPEVLAYLKKCPEPTKSRLLQSIEQLAANPRPSGVKKLKAHKNLYRIRTGDY